jgi:hypothetical protein
MIFILFFFFFLFFRCDRDKSGWIDRSEVLLALQHMERDILPIMVKEIHKYVCVFFF